MGKRDIILLGTILCAAAICFCLINFTKQNGNIVVIYVNNAEYARLPLDEDAEFIIGGVNSSTNILIVKDGYVYMSEASCPDKICIGTGKISKENDMIVCLPNKVVAVIERND